MPTRSHGSFTSESKSFSYFPVNIVRASRDGESKRPVTWQTLDAT